MPRSSRPWPAVLIAGAFVLAACGGGSHHAASSPSPSPVISSSTPSPTATATVGATTCPLTGQTPSAGQNRNRVALAVKIDNIDAARPQYGLDHADVVVEEQVEGGLTRLFAIFQCDRAERVEPIRSARTSDADLLALLHGSVFAFSGANPGALPPIRAHGNAVLISYDDLGGVFHRDPSRSAPHNVVSSTTTMLNAGLARRKGLTAPPPMFGYGALDSSATVATGVTLRWPAQSAAWTWTGGSWARTQNGTADVLANGRRVTTSNVVIMSILLGSTGLRDVAGNASPLDITVGGPRSVWVLRDGHVIKGTWSRRSINAGWRLLDAAGHPILLRPGPTWVELLPRGRVPAIR